MRELRLNNIDKLSKKELKQGIENCFDYAPEADPVDRLAILQEAQFYTRELEHRRDSWVSIRDFLLEIAVIGLIGWEIWMGYRAEDLQKQNFKEEKTVLVNLRDSSGATAETLVAVKDAMNAMKIATEKQVELFYDVEVSIAFDDATERLLLTNTGRGRVSLAELTIQADPIQHILYDKPQVITPAGVYFIPLKGLHAYLSEQLPKGQTRKFAFTFLLRNEKEEKITITGDIIATWVGDAPSIVSQTNTILPGWPKK